MKISIITLFPEMFEPVLNTSILKRAQNKGKVEFELINLRDFGEGVHQIVDGRPYGGGAGMILRADILTCALRSVISPKLLSKREKNAQFSNPNLQSNTNDSNSNKNFNIENSLKIDNCKLKIILTSASGTPYKQAHAQEFSKLDHIIIVCGHYEGVDQRFIDKYVDQEISIGDYVLTGGEIPAMAIADSIVRLIPGVLEKPEAVQEESFSISNLKSQISNLLEYPHYTRPDVFEEEKVPEVLTSGDHQKVADWRQEKSLEKTKKVRPDLLK